MSRTPEPGEGPSLTHQAEDGRVRMVDVADKAETHRQATAEGVLRMAPGTLQLLQQGRTPKGDPLLVAQVAGIQGGKRTADLIPLCHPLPLSQVEVELRIDETIPGIRARASTKLYGRTGVEMEALTAVSVALLTAYDMLKAVDRDMCIEGIRVMGKSGGRSGSWGSAQADAEAAR